MVRADHPYGLIPSLLLRVSLSPVWCIGALGMASAPPWQRWVGGNDRGEWRVRRFGPMTRR